MWPSTLSSFSNPVPTDRLNAPSHSSVETAQNTGITRVETFIGLTSGVNASAVGTILYDVRSPDSNGGGHVQTANRGGTGQTSYTKGDLLVATSSSVLSKLAVGGTTNFALIVDPTAAAGVKWGVPGNTPVTRVYNLASTLVAWIKPSNLAYIEVEVLGAGGSGFAAANVTGGGGGGGGYARGVIPASLLSGREDIVIGTTTVSSVGGLSRFGSIISCGGGGVGGNPDAGAAGSVSGTYSSSLFSIQNMAGQPAINDAGPVVDMAAAGNGANTIYGQGGQGATTTTAAASGNMAGRNAVGYGAGGGGGVNTGPGNAAPGLVIIREY